MVVIKQCTCDHEFQDKMYGKKNRVWNIGKELNSSSVQIVCSVCGKKDSTVKK